MPARRALAKFEDRINKVARCSKCKEWKTFDDFSPGKGDGLNCRRITQSSCKKCCSEWVNEKNKKAREAEAAYENSIEKLTCRKCGETKAKELMRLRKVNQSKWKHTGDCVECDRQRYRDKYKRKNAQYKARAKELYATPKRRSAVMFTTTRARCNHAGVAFTLTREWFHKRCVTGICEVTGLCFDFNPGKNCRNLMSPSVDRIDPLQHYTEENCQMVTLGYNMAKNDSTHEDVMKMARALVKKEQEMMFTPPYMI